MRGEETGRRSDRRPEPDDRRPEVDRREPERPLTGGVPHDVCEALSSCFGDPNPFKAFIVLHTMILHGSMDNVLRGSDRLRLSNVSSGNWDGAWLPYVSRAE